MKILKLYHCRQIIIDVSAFTSAISCLLFLLHIYIKSNISQLLDTLTASSDLLSIPQSPVRVCLSAPIDIIIWRDLLISVHSAPVDTYVTGWMSAVYGESPYCRAQKPFAETTPRDACWLITSSFIVRVMHMYLCVCEWLAWMPPGVHLFVSWLWDEACVGGRMFIELVIRLNASQSVSWITLLLLNLKQNILYVLWICSLNSI